MYFHVSFILLRRTGQSAFTTLSPINGPICRGGSSSLAAIPSLRAPTSARKVQSSGRNWSEYNTHTRTHTHARPSPFSVLLCVFGLVCWSVFGHLPSFPVLIPRPISPFSDPVGSSLVSVQPGVLKSYESKRVLLFASPVE